MHVIYLVKADASIVCASGNHAPEDLLGRLGKVVHVKGSEVRLKFKGGTGGCVGGSLTGLIFVSARTNKRHHHHQPSTT